MLQAEYAALYGAKERFEQEKQQLVKASEDQEIWVTEQRDDLLRFILLLLLLLNLLSVYKTHCPYLWAVTSNSGLQSVHEK